jgi:hypothetical protein
LKPDPHAELAAIRADIIHLAQVAATSTDRKALQSLQRSLTNWLHKHMSKEQSA